MISENSFPLSYKQNKMISNQIIGRFEEAVALHHAIVAFKFRTNKTDPTVAMVTQIAVAILEAQMIDLLELGICEYQNANKNAAVVQEATKDDLSLAQREHNDSEEGRI
jgi:hypothetical protein